MNSTLSVGFLGISHPHFAGRLRALQSFPNIQVTALYDPDEQKAQENAQALGAKAYTRAEDLLQHEPLHLVILEGRNKENAHHAFLSARARKPFLLEKPGAESLSSLQRVARAVKENGVFCQVGYHLRFSPSVQKTRDILQKNLLGTITTGRFHCAVQAPWLTDPWFCDPDDPGGLVFNDFCHIADLLLWLLGPPKLVSASIVKRSDRPPHPYEDSAALILAFGDLLVAGDCCGWEINPWVTTWEIELYGTSATLQCGIHPPRLSLYSPEPSQCLHESDPEYDGEENYKRELSALLKDLNKGAPTEGASIDDALLVMQLIQGVYQDNLEGNHA